MKVYRQNFGESGMRLIRTGGADQEVTPRSELLYAAGEYTRLGERKKKVRREIRKPRCENCDRETDYLFEGFQDPPQVAVVELYQFKGKPATKAQVRALCAPFSTVRARVCMGCRPPSNLEIEEILGRLGKRSKRCIESIVRASNNA